MNLIDFSQGSHLCHLCNSLQEALENDFKKCGRKQCRKVYCIKCIEQNFAQQIYSDDCVDSVNDWTCYSCQGMCNCKQCSFYHQQSSQIKQNHRKQTTKNPHQTNKTYPNHSSDYISQFRQQSHSPFQYSQQLPYYSHNQKKQRGIGKSKKQKSLMGLKYQNGKKMPPYLVSIMKRKQAFKKFMLNHSKKTYEQLIKESLNRKQQKLQKQFLNYPSPVMKSQNLVSNQNSINDFIQYSPSQVPLTPSFLPLSQPFSTNGLRLTEMLNEKLKQYQVEEDDLSLELL